MRKFGNILVIFLFINFITLPSIRAVWEVDIPQTNLIINEEEKHSSSFEKIIPKTIQIHDFIKFFQYNLEKDPFVLKNETELLDPHLSTFSPPPEFSVFSTKFYPFN